MASPGPCTFRILPPSRIRCPVRPLACVVISERCRRHQEGLCDRSHLHWVQCGQHFRAILGMSLNTCRGLLIEPRHTQVNVKQADVKYRTTWISTIVVMAFTIAASLVLRVILSRENSRRDKIALASPHTQQVYASEKASDMAASQTSVAEGIMHVDRDLTDWEDPNFRYSL